MPFTVEQFLLMCRYPYMSPFASVRPDDRKVVREAMVGTGASAFYKLTHSGASTVTVSTNDLRIGSGLTLKSDNYDYDPATGTLTEKK